MAKTYQGLLRSSFVTTYRCRASSQRAGNPALMSVWLLSIAKKRSPRCLRLGIQPECLMILHGYRGSSRMRSTDPDPPLTSSGNPRFKVPSWWVPGCMKGYPLGPQPGALVTLRYWNAASLKSACGRLTPEQYGPCGFITRRLTRAG
jgi:hypothetical protein